MSFPGEPGFFLESCSALKSIPKYTEVWESPLCISMLSFCLINICTFIHILSISATSTHNPAPHAPPGNNSLLTDLPHIHPPLQPKVAISLQLKSVYSFFCFKLLNGSPLFLDPHYRFSASLRYHIPFFHRTFVQIISSEWSPLSYDHPTQITGMIYLPEINLIPALPQGSLFQTKSNLSVICSHLRTFFPFFYQGSHFTFILVILWLMTYFPTRL